MSIVYRIDKEKALTYVLWYGEVAPDDQIAHAKRLAADPDWPACRGLQLIDLRKANVDAISLDSLQRAADFYGKKQNHLAGMKVAMVAGDAFRKSIAFARMMEKYRLSMIAFNSLDTACAWLGIDLEDAEVVLDVLEEIAKKS